MAKKSTWERFKGAVKSVTGVLVGATLGVVSGAISGMGRALAVFGPDLLVVAFFTAGIVPLAFAAGGAAFGALAGGFYGIKEGAKHGPGPAIASAFTWDDWVPPKEGKAQYAAETATSEKESVRDQRHASRQDSRGIVAGLEQAPSMTAKQIMRAIKSLYKEVMEELYQTSKAIDRFNDSLSTSMYYLSNNNSQNAKNAYLDACNLQSKLGPMYQDLSGKMGVIDSYLQQLKGMNLEEGVEKRQLARIESLVGVDSKLKISDIHVKAKINTAKHNLDQFKRNHVKPKQNSQLAKRVEQAEQGLSTPPLRRGL